MSDYLPYGGFKWLKNVDSSDVNSNREKSPIGYILEVDLEYPDKLHALHNEKLPIPFDMLSDYCKKIAGEYEVKVGDVMKLISNLGGKTKHIVHYKNHPLYVSLGMKLTKIHSVLKFKQFDWMKIHIDFNTEKRKNAANSSEKTFLS